MKTNVKATDLDEETADAIQEMIQESSDLLKHAGETPKNIVRMMRERVDKLLKEEHSDDELNDNMQTLLQLLYNPVHPSST